MKVIAQLIQHFWQRQALSHDQAAYLVRQGFARAADLPGLDLADEPEFPDVEPAPAPAVPPHPLDVVEETLKAKTPARRGRGKPKGRVLTEAGLAKAVAAIFQERAPALERMRQWAADLGEADDWIEAAVLIRQAGDGQVLDALIRAIRKRTVSLADLWNALDLEPLHALIDEPDLRGSVPRVFRLLLATDGPLPVTHTGMLKHAPLEAAKSVGTAHRRLRTAIHAVQSKHPKVLSNALKHGNHPVVFWMVTLLYNARRRPLDGPTRFDREYRLEPLPTAAVWRQAWAAAMAIDAKAVTALLIASYRDEQEQHAREPLACQKLIHCPLAWRAPEA